MYGDKRQTEAWRLYQLGVQYNQQLIPNQYDLVQTNIEFFTGNQWRGLSNSSAMAALPKPVFNIIKRIGSLFVASLTSTSSKVTFEPLANKQEGEDDTAAIKAAQMATSEVDNLFDKLKMDYRVRDALFDGAQTGDYCAHFYWDANAKPYGGAYGAYRGEICMELVDGLNVMFGNPSTPFVEKQPYILIVGRDTVENLRAEYKQHHQDKIAEDLIRPDLDYEYQAGTGGHTELGDNDKTGKTLFVYYYTKKTHEEKVLNPDGTPQMEPVLGKDGQPVIEKGKNGLPLYNSDGTPVYKMKPVTEMVTTVHVSKHTKYVDIFDEVDTGLTYYPIAWGNWEKQKNQYHGRALVTGIIPNQIYINSMFALIMRHQQMLGFPKTLYDANVIGQWNNAVGQAIAVYDLPPDKRMNDLYGVIQPADMSTQIMRCIEMAMQYTKECLGATDAQLGNLRADNTSAIIALQSSSQVPLENPQANKYEWVEDIGRILLDMMGTYYGKRPVVLHEEKQSKGVDPTTGMPTDVYQKNNVIEMYDFSQLKHLWLNVRADVGASTYWSRIAVVQTLDNLKQAGVLDVLDYLERMPDEYVPRKDELVAKLRQQMQEPQMPPEMMQGMPTEGGVAPTEQIPPEFQGRQPVVDPSFGANPGVAWGADAEANPAAVIASMPNNIQEMYGAMNNRVKNTLLAQTRLNTVGV